MRRGALLAVVALAACATTATRATTTSAPDGMIAVPAVAVFLDRTPVTVAAWRASGLPSEAERTGGEVLDLATGRWRIVPGATYAYPEGPGGNAAADDEPATQISWADATAFCARRGARLPTEDEWEAAARNGRGDRTLYPWGDAPTDRGRWRLNAWQGAFPTANTLDDGYLFASPVGAFPPTPLGFVDLVGNVWQWTSTAEGAERVMRGGSYLCDPDVCHGYRIAGRQTATPDSALMHVGFRCAQSAR
ncbi:MAG: SUMF1/EgtB/PvdO family nonheme iron enzyme [Sandaracinus sp.]